MKKLILLSLIAALAIVTACNKDEGIEAVPPSISTWDELIPIPIRQPNGTISMEQLTWAGMLEAHTAGTVNLDTLKYIIRQIEFVPSGADRMTGIMRITIHYGDGRPILGENCRNLNFPNINIRTEYLEISYAINVSSHDGRRDINEISVVSGRYTGSAFGTTNPGPCSSTGNIENIAFEYSYEDSSPRRMRFVQIAPTDENPSGIQSTHILVERP